MGMNPKTHQFEPLDSPAAVERAHNEGWKIFKIGEKVTINGTAFRVEDISPNKLILRPYGTGLANEAGKPHQEYAGPTNFPEPGTGLLLTHQERVVVEKFELDAKIGKLTAFTKSDVFSSLIEAEQERLSRQLTYMTGYSEVLADRIACF